MTEAATWPSISPVAALKIFPVTINGCAVSAPEVAVRTFHRDLRSPLVAKREAAPGRRNELLYYAKNSRCISLMPHFHVDNDSSNGRKTHLSSRIARLLNEMLKWQPKFVFYISASMQCIEEKRLVDLSIFIHIRTTVYYYPVSQWAPHTAQEIHSWRICFPTQRLVWMSSINAPRVR